jgi:hypothetical protein
MLPQQKENIMNQTNTSIKYTNVSKMAVFLVAALCCLVEVYQCFKGPCCLHHQGNPDDGGNKVL